MSGDVMEIVLNRPSKKNALRNEDWQLLADLAKSVSSSNARCLIVRGEGGSFCSGWDLSGRNDANFDARSVVVDYVNPALMALRNIEIPTIAAVSGICLGGGFGIAMVCDIVLTAEDAIFGSPFRSKGIMLDAGGHYFLRDRLGHHKASQFIYTGKMITGGEAHQLGLVCESYPAEKLLEEARLMAQDIASGPTMAFKASKRVLLAGLNYQSSIDMEAREQGLVFETADATEGVSAFLQKRQPVFHGH